MKNTIYNVNSDNSCTMNISTLSMRCTELVEVSKGHSKGRKLLTLNSSLLTVLTVLLCLMVGGKAWGQSTLTVYENETSTNSYIPLYGFDGDYYQKTEFVIPASELSTISGTDITGMNFHISGTMPTKVWGPFDVYLKEVNFTTISGWQGTTGATKVYNGNFDGTSGTVTVAFNGDHPTYRYNGGNLLVVIYLITTDGQWNSASFYGKTVTGASGNGYNNSALESCTFTQRNFIPRTTFTYIPTTPTITLSPSSATILTGSTQTLTATRYNVSGTPTISYTSSNTSVATVSGSGTTATVTAVAEGSATITASMTYSGQTYTATSTITVIDACQPTWSGSNSYYISNFAVSRSGTTLLNNSSTGTGRTTTNYYATKSITAEPGDELSCTITMSSSGTYGFALWVDFDKDGLEADDYKFKTSSYQYTPYTGTFTIPANTPAGEYRMRILGDYNTDAPSNPCGTYSNGEAEDYKLIVIVPTCSRPTDLVVSNITNSSAKLTWTPGGDETQWEVAYSTTGTPPSSGTNKTATTHTFAGLTANTQYYAHVRAKCSSSDYSNWVTVPFTTQKTPATIPYSHGFEDTESSENGNWILTSGVAQTNSWCRGTAEKKTGSYGLYITNNKNGTPPPNAYSNTAASYVYAYREVNFTSTGEYTFSFDWKAYGESNYDLLRAFLVPINLSSDLSDGTINGMGSSTNTTPSGWIDIANPAGKLNLQTSWQSSEQTKNISAGTYCLAFFWKNDGSGGTAPPAAVDNVSITTNAPPTHTITATANPAEGGTVTFMTGPASSSSHTHLPLDSYRDNSFSQQIYTPDEIGGGTINSISLYSVGGNLNEDNIIYTRNLDVYLAHTNKAEFSSNTDWISNSDSPDMVRVYSGNVTFNCEEWNTINFTTAFNYDGTRNLLLVIADNTNVSAEVGNYLECKTFTPSSGGNCSLNFGWGQFDPSSPSGNGELLTVKNQILVNGSSTRTFPQGASCTLVATANANYNFDNWTEGSTELSTNEVYTVSNITADHTIVGNFSLPTFTLTTSVNPTGGGTITCSPSSANGVYTYGTVVTLTANAATGYTFQNWTVDGETVSGSPTSVTMTADHNVVANFTINTYTVTYNANGGSGTMSNTSGQYNTSVTLSSNGFTAPAGKTFDSWNTNPSGTGTSYTEGQSYTITGNITLYAQWVDIPRTVTISAPGVVCTSSETVLEVTNVTGFANPQYTWSASPSAGAGLPADIHTSRITVTPDAGNYTYTCEVTEEGESAPSYSIGDAVYVNQSTSELVSTSGSGITQGKVMRVSGNTITALFAVSGGQVCGASTAPTGATSTSGVTNTNYIRGLNPTGGLFYNMLSNWYSYANGFYVPSISELDEYVSNSNINNLSASSSTFASASGTNYSFYVYNSGTRTTSSGATYTVCKDFIVSSGVSGSVTVNVFQAPSVSFSPSTISECSSPVSISADLSGTDCNSFYQWTGGSETNAYSDLSVTESGTYYLTVTNRYYQQYDMITQNGISAIVVVVPTYTTDGIAVPIGTGGIGANATAGNVADGALTNLQEAIKVNGGETYSGNREGFVIPAGAAGGVCQSTASVEVEINTPAVGTVTASAAPATICNGGSSELTAGATGNSGTMSYAWSNGESGATVSVSPTVNTTYTVTATATVGGCIATTTKQVTVAVNSPAVGTVTASAAPATICNGSSSELTASATGNTGTMSYAWSNGESGATVSVSPTVNTTYTVTATATVGGCIATTTKQVTVAVNSPAVGTVTATADPATICVGKSAELSVSTTGNNGDMTYTWSSGSTTVTPNVTTTYTVTATATTAIAGCTAETTKDVTITVTTPSVDGIASGDMVWSGNAGTTNWATADNWLTYDGSAYSVAASAPSSSTNVFLATYGECVTSDPVLTAAAATQNLTIGSGRAISLESNTLSVAGNLTNSGTFTAGTGTVVFNGSTHQTISGSSLTFYNVIFDNDKHFTFSGLTPTVNAEATFSSGIVNGNMNFGASATSASASLTSHVDGKVTKAAGSGEFTFPTGNAGVLGSVTATVTADTWVRFHNLVASGDDLPADYPRYWNVADNCSGNDPQFDHVSNFEYWDINSPDGLSGAIVVASADNANKHFGSTDPAPTATDVFGAIWTGSCWNNIGGSNQYVSDDYTTIIVRGVNIPSVTRAGTPYFTLGSKAHETLLPIELLSFTATCDGRSALVEWTTATECNNDYFVLERSDDAINFTELARVAGAGNSIDPIDYAYTDYGIHGGDSYYRLVQVDYDGTRAVSEVVVVNCIETAAGEPDVQAYPNPFYGELTLELENFDNRPARIDVYDMLGKLIYTDKVASPQNYYETVLNLSNLPPATYTVRVSTADFVINKKVVKQ